MKILFVNNFKGRGGGEEFLRDLLPGLAEMGVEVGLVCRPETPLAHMFSGTTIRLYPVQRSGFNAVSSVFKIAEVIRKEGYEVINIQRGHDIVQSWAASCISGAGPILMHTLQVPEFIKSRFLLGRMHRIITISRYVVEKITSYAPSVAGRVNIIHYGIDLSKFRPASTEKGWLRRRFGVSQDAPVIGTVGDLWKNQIEFLDALVDIRKEFPGARYAIVASESEVEEVREFKERVNQLRLSDAVLWVGRLSKEEMPLFYADINVAVSTHRNEGFGIWLLEAMAMGAPVVAFNAGGVRDSLEGCSAGILVDGGARGLAAVVLRVLKDPEQRRRMSGSGPKWVVEKFGRARMTEDYYRFFESEISRRRGLRPVLTAGHATAAKSPRRILYMISKSDRYGAQRIFLDQVSILHRMGNYVIVAGKGADGYVADAVRDMGVPYEGISFKGAKDLFLLKDIAKRHRIDVIHSTLDRADYFGVFLSKISGVPVVSTMMVPRYHYGFRFADKVVVLSRKQRGVLEGKRMVGKKITVIRPGVDVPRFSAPDAEKKEAWRRRLKAGEYGIIFCHVSSLIPRKAHGVSLELAAECKKKGERPLLIIIGDPVQGEYYESLKKTIERLGLEDNVHFTGWTSEVPEILSLSHYSILPSENEALGVVLLEGMAAGTPIIAREGEGGAEIIEEFDAGFLYRPAEGVASLADGVIALRRDSRRYEELSGRCKRIALDEFSMTKFGERLSDLYQNING